METPTELTLRNGWVVTPHGVLRGGLTASAGVITSVGADDSLPRGRQDIDVRGKLIFPGVIDPHTHMGMGDPMAFERDFSTESRDAVCGGVTTLITTCLFGPSPRVPEVRESIAAGERSSHADFRVTAAMTTRAHVEEIPELVGLGVRSFKYLWGYKRALATGFGGSESGVPTDLFWLSCERFLSAHPKAFPMVHAEDPDVRDLFNSRWRALDPRGCLVSWAHANPNVLEPLQLAQAAWIAESVGVPLYMVHVSSHEAVQMIREFKQKGWRTVGETLTAFLYWTAEEADAKGVGALGKVQPAIKFARDREALWKGLRDGTITQIGTDSLVYSREEATGDLWERRPGLGPGMGTSLPAIVTAGLGRGRITLEQMARVMCENVARQFDLYPTKGVLQVGSDADIVVLDPTVGGIVTAARLHSASEYSLYEGEELSGWPGLVFVRGRLVARDGAPVSSEAHGRFVPPVTGAPGRDGPAGCRPDGGRAPETGGPS